ncbi:MAG TPA: complex I NDUFA9 subunit family protein [Gaiellaceae bacterium]|jgi:NADH dehydrogenase|nr:complex I NDUFA9 subunit family protein [Gaiellaceae bacterium]
MILVTGGTGFVGPKIVHALRAEDAPVRALVRDPSSSSARTLSAWGCELVQGDATDPESLRGATEGADSVVHLIALIAGKPEEYERVMSQGTRDLVAAAKEARVSRFVLMSALGTTEESKDLVPYYRSKWDMEQTVKASGIEYVIFRPSFVFGKDGGVLPTFLRQVKYSPVTPVPGSGTRRLQPIWVDDVAAFFARSLSTEEAANKTFDLGGPDRLTWNELYERIRRTLGKRRPTVHVPMGLMRAGAALAEKLPHPPVTRDQLTMLENADNVGDVDPAIGTFGVHPISLEEQLRRAAAG